MRDLRIVRKLMIGDAHRGVDRSIGDCVRAWNDDRTKTRSRFAEHRRLRNDSSCDQLGFRPFRRDIAPERCDQLVLVASVDV